MSAIERGICRGCGMWRQVKGGVICFHIDPSPGNLRADTCDGVGKAPQANPVTERPAGFVHQWWCRNRPCRCAPAYVAYELDRLAGLPVAHPGLDVTAGPVCAACVGSGIVTVEAERDWSDEEWEAAIAERRAWTGCTRAQAFQILEKRRPAVTAMCWQSVDPPTRHPVCRGNGGGRMSPRQMAAWISEGPDGTRVEEPQE